MSSCRGSEWHKWDLHVHTPASIVQHYGGNTNAAWDKYLLDLEALPPEFKVLGINDYLFLDGYKRLKKEKDQNGRLPNIDLLLPVVEFRIEKFAGVEFRDLQRINLHVIFSDKLSVETIQSQFLNTLEQSYQIERDGSAWHRAITRESVQELGRTIIESAPLEERHKYGSKLQEGFNALNVKEDQIFSSLRKDCFEDKYLTAIGKTEWDKLRWTDASISTKKDIINRADMVFTSAEDVVAFHNATEKLAMQQVNNLLLDCSDAHRFSDSENKDRIGKCFTWIKAKTTFEGLRQIIFEPERVKVEEFHPATKNAYQVMKELRFVDTSNTNFSNDSRIGLNADLNSIIGGKSSGKSLLLYHIAKATMDPQRFRKLSAYGGFQQYDEVDGFDLEVVWENGNISKLSSEENKKPIIYIPQMYLNYMAEQKSDNQDFKTTVDEILKSNTGYADFIEGQKHKIFRYEQEISQAINAYMTNAEKLNQLNAELLSLGDENGIKGIIETLKADLESLRLTAGFQTEEEEQYKLHIESKASLEQEKNSLEKKKNVLNESKLTLEQIVNRLPSFIDEEFSDVLHRYSQDESLKSIASTIATQTSLRLNNTIKGFLTEEPCSTTQIDFDIERIGNELKGVQDSLKPFEEKIKNLEYFRAKQKHLLGEEEKLSNIDSKKKEIAVQQALLEINSIRNPYIQLLNAYQEINRKNNTYSNISDGIELISELSFNAQSFKRDFSHFITKNRNLEQLFDAHGFTENEFNFSEAEHIDNFMHICQKILDGTINFNQNKQPNEMLLALFKNYFEISYDLKQDGDRLGHMSPGKKGIILFQLFLHLSSSKDPILIDQPEDNLDNRTVYKELNDFIKNKKLERQIIIVSHNSNLVVSTDSENVIVAHQNGTGTGRSKFEYINGALENTFIDSSTVHVLEKQGIREHVCEILEGGKEAFKKREQKYNI